MLKFACLKNKQPDLSTEFHRFYIKHSTSRIEWGGGG